MIIVKTSILDYWEIIATEDKYKLGIYDNTILTTNSSLWREYLVYSPNSVETGFSMISYDRNNKIATLQMVYIRPEYRHNGHAKKLVNLSIDHCTKSGLRRIETCSYGEKSNLYKKWEYVGKHQKSIIDIDGNYIDRHIYGQLL